MRVDKNRLHRPLLIVVLLLCWLLLNLHLEDRSLWTDELFTAEWTKLSVAELVQRTADDFHPPLYFLLVKVWSAGAGKSDFALRWPSVAAGWLSVAVLYRLGRKWGTRGTALLGAGLWGLSPALILYARMARYYSLAALLGVVATYALWRALTDSGGAGHARRFRWFAYAVASWSAIFTFYLSGMLILAHGCLVLLLNGRRQLLRWLTAILAVAALSLPWAGVVTRQAVRTGSGAADLAFGAAGFGLKVAYSAYAFAVGESLFPWRPLAVVGAICVLLLCGAGIAGWRRRRLALPLTGLLVIPLVAVMLVIGLVSPRTPFTSVPARALFAAPFFALIVAGAPGGLRQRFLVPLLAVVGITWGVTLWNYYHDADFLNPIYLTPARQMVGFVEPQLQAGDMVYSEWDSGFDYYYAQTATRAPHFTDTREAIAYLESGQASRVWRVTLGRDQSESIVAGSLSLDQWLEGRFAPTAAWGFTPQDETYRLIKSLLLGRPAYPYRASVSLYVR